MLKLRIQKWNGKCRKHPRYDPAMGGRNAIVGACRFCETLYEIHQRAAELSKAITAARAEFPATRERKAKPSTEHQYTIEEMLQEGTA